MAQSAETIAPISRGNEPFIKKVWYGIGKVEKVLESQSPDAWQKRIMKLVDEKIVPGLSAEHQETAAKIRPMIESVATGLGIGITTAEIVGVVVAADKALRLLRPERVASVSKIIPLESSPPNPFVLLKQAIDKHVEIVPHPNLRLQIAGTVAALFASGIDPTAQDVVGQDISPHQMKKGLRWFRRRFAQAFRTAVSIEDGRPPPASHINEQFLNWMQILRASDAPGHDRAELKDWVEGKRRATNTKSATRLERKFNRARRKDIGRKVREFSRHVDVAEKYKIRDKQQKIHREAYIHKPIRSEKKHRTSPGWEQKPKNASQSMSKTVGHNEKKDKIIQKIRSRDHLTKMSGVLRFELDTPHTRLLRGALEQVMDPGARQKLDQDALVRLNSAIGDGNIQNIVNTLGTLIVGAMASSVGATGVNTDAAALHQVFDTYMLSGAPGLARLLDSIGLPHGKSKHLARQMRSLSASQLPRVHVTQPEHKMRQLKERTVVPAQIRAQLVEIRTSHPPNDLIEHVKSLFDYVSQDRSHVTPEEQIAIREQMARHWVASMHPGMGETERNAFIDAWRLQNFDGIPVMHRDSLQRFMNKHVYDKVDLPPSAQLLSIAEKRPHILESLPSRMLTREQRKEIAYEKRLARDEERARKLEIASHALTGTPTDEEIRRAEQSILDRKRNETITLHRKNNRRRNRIRTAEVVREVDARIAAGHEKKSEEKMSASLMSQQVDSLQREAEKRESDARRSQEIRAVDYLYSNLARDIDPAYAWHDARRGMDFYIRVREAVPKADDGNLRQLAVMMDKLRSMRDQPKIREALHTVTYVQKHKVKPSMARVLKPSDYALDLAVVDLFMTAEKLDPAGSNIETARMYTRFAPIAKLWSSDLKFYGMSSLLGTQSEAMPKAPAEAEKVFARLMQAKAGEAAKLVYDVARKTDGEAWRLDKDHDVKIPTPEMIALAERGFRLSHGIPPERELSFAQQVLLREVATRIITSPKFDLSALYGRFSKFWDAKSRTY